MAQDWALAFYKSRAWIDCRAGYIASVFGLCERCQEAGLIVHHKIVLTLKNISDPFISLNWEHLELTCMDCHNKEHHGSSEPVTRDGLMFNVWGELEETVSPP